MRAVYKIHGIITTVRRILTENTHDFYQLGTYLFQMNKLNL